ncbi:hypothetical protein [Dyella amyloliquefaciens]|uniref:hypothetical protein n=1 Tax=Dyella amyloliquefaciens TaxID=1770545 RepID=UPI00197AEC0D|nr:hypothetical protein [Dyella amyloliquefaciens]
MDRSQQAMASSVTSLPVPDRAYAAPHPSQVGLAASMIGLGVLGLIYGDVALVWQHLPIEHLPGEKLIAYAFALIELVGGMGLLVKPLAKPASALLAAFLLIWAVLLKLPAVVFVPLMEATWLGFGEIAVILAGAWVLLARYAGNHEHGKLSWLYGRRGVRAARVLFAVSLPMIGLSHFFYSEQTAALIPAWLPYPLGWAYFTGACSILTCVAVLSGVLSRVAATLEAAMLWMITLLVWAPAIMAHPSDRTAWTAFVISAAIACGAWVVADSYRERRYDAS